VSIAAKNVPAAAPLDHQKIIQAFHSHFYQRHNRRRQEHLASLRLNLANATVLEVGAAIGDHTDFFLDRGCSVVTTEARPESLELLKARYPGQEYPHVEVRSLDLDHPDDRFADVFDIVYCYGVLYHLSRPAQAIEFMASHCRGVLLLETRVSYGDGEAVNPCQESPSNPVQSIWGRGCRPTRDWVYSQLRRNFEFVYLTRTQPFHEEFPIDWTCPPPPDLRTRSVFVASRHPLENDLLVQGIPMRQTR